MKSGNFDFEVGRSFAYWRVDFLMDLSAKVWLLEVEVVPSTGTIGGGEIARGAKRLAERMHVRDAGAQIYRCFRMLPTSLPFLTS